MATNVSIKLVCFAFLVCMLISSPTIYAISCSQVANFLAPCLGYLTKGGQLPPNCCKGVQSLNSAARSTPDRKTACGCMKSAAGSIRGIIYANAASLPSKCGVNIPYKISPSTDCSRVT